MYNEPKGADLIAIFTLLLQLMAPPPVDQAAIMQQLEEQSRQKRIEISADRIPPAELRKKVDPKPAPKPEPQPQPEAPSFVVTAYTAGFESTGKRPGDAGYGVTASGAVVREGVTAACPRSIPLGTRIHVEGIGDRICQDRGGAITEGRLDLYMRDLDRALEFGKQTRKVTIKG